MSYDLHLNDPVTGEELELDAPHALRGGTYVAGGTRRAWLNITYNYAPHFYHVLDAEQGIRVLYGKTGAESLTLLDAAIAQLGDDVDPDYWAATQGNAKRALFQLRALAQMRPDGIWDGD